MPESIQHLYKYGQLNRYSEALFSTGEVYFPSPAELNDPFECHPHLTLQGTEEQFVGRLVPMLRKHCCLTEEEAITRARALYRQGALSDRRNQEAFRNDMRRTLDAVGLYCLSQDPTNILMWSHYACNHQGYCLQFEATRHTVVFGEAQPVLYSDEYPIVDYFDTPMEKQATLAVLTKYTCWAYEKEWRIIDHKNGRGLRAYPPELLKGVIFGLRMPECDKARIRGWVSRRGCPVQFYQAKQHPRKFLIELQTVN